MATLYTPLSGKREWIYSDHYVSELWKHLSCSIKLDHNVKLGADTGLRWIREGDGQGGWLRYTRTTRFTVQRPWAAYLLLCWQCSLQSGEPKGVVGLAEQVVDCKMTILTYTCVMHTGGYYKDFRDVPTLTIPIHTDKTYTCVCTQVVTIIDLSEWQSILTHDCLMHTHRCLL